MLSFDETRHLTVRTAFGADLSVLLHLRNLNQSEAVRRMLDRNKQSSPPPYVTPSRVVFRKRKNASREEKQLIRKRIIGETNSMTSHVHDDCRPVLALYTYSIYE